MSTDSNKRNNIINNNFKENGIDHRFKKTTDFDSTSNIKIMNNINNKNLIDKLENNDTSIFDKLKIVSDHNILNDSMSYNIYAGGLLNDYYFNF